MKLNTLLALVALGLLVWLFYPQIFHVAGIYRGLREEPPIPSDCVLIGREELGGSGTHLCTWEYVNCPSTYKGERVDYCYVHYYVQSIDPRYPSGWLDTKIKVPVGTYKRWSWCSSSDWQNVKLYLGYCKMRETTTTTIPIHEPTTTTIPSKEERPSGILGWIKAFIDWLISLLRGGR